MTQKSNLIIIGSGPAGYTAGIYASRAQLEPLLFTGEELGGQLSWTTEMENYPGFPEGIQGPELMQKFKDQAEKFGTEIVNKKIEKVDFGVFPFRLWTTDNTEHNSRSVIIATGASANWLGLENENRLKGRGVSSCATCDGFFFKDKDVVVVGGGDVAIEDAILLSKIAKSVKVIHRRDCLRASEFMQKRARDNNKISFVWNSEVVDILGSQKVEGVYVKNNQTDKEDKIQCEGVFVAIGHHPNTDIFKGQIELEDKFGYIVAKNGIHSSVDGVFAAGDVVDFKYRQAVTAASMGCMAAIDAEKWLDSFPEEYIKRRERKEEC